jgi:RNA polymerase sigma-70 factor (ECF subfamily)
VRAVDSPLDGRSTEAGSNVDPGGAEARNDAEELALVEALRRGDEAAFALLVDRYQKALVRLALSYVPNREAAEDVVQETWMGVVRGIDRFEARSSLKTWLFRILVNRAKSKGVAERRQVPFSSLEEAGEPEAPAVDPSRFFDESSRWAGFWSTPPERWEGIPDERLLGKETRAVVEEVIAELPPTQRAVISMRDIRGLDSGEVCEILDISEVNQRVLLHRARSKVRARLEEYLTPTAAVHP